MKTKTILILVTVVAFLIRFYLSWQYPPLSWDEAALGYNAYSILKTGRDEHGQLLPLIFKSFGDYKPGLYVYLAVPFIQLFGLNEISVRLPSIIFGSLTPLFLYLLITAISPKQKKLGLIAALILTFNPFNIHFSKAAWETNVLTFELVLATYLFFKRRPCLSAIVFALSLYTYQAGKMISLLIITVLFVVNLKKISLSSYFVRFCLPLFIFSIPIFLGLFLNNDSNRLKVVSLFSYPRSQKDSQVILSESNFVDYLLFHHPYFYLARQFFVRYFNYFSPRFLINEGDWQNPRHGAPYIGIILYPSLLFFILGIFSKKSFQKPNLFFLLWLILAPIPSALTRDLVQSVRSMSLSVPLVYFIAVGIHRFLIFFQNRRITKYFAYSFLFTGYFISFLYYSDLYYQHMVKKSPYDFLYGYKQAVLYVFQNQSRHQQVYFSDYFQQPYIFYLFYSQYSPSLYQSQNKLISQSLDVGRVEKIDNILFSILPYEAIKTKTGTLTVFSNEDINQQVINKTSEFEKNFIPISPINNYSTFYAYQN